MHAIFPPFFLTEPGSDVPKGAVPAAGRLFPGGEETWRVLRTVQRCADDIFIFLLINGRCHLKWPMLCPRTILALSFNIVMFRGVDIYAF